MTTLVAVAGGVLLAGILLLARRLHHRERALDSAVQGMARQEPMAQLGMLLAGIAHEMNTPIGAIHCSLDTRRRGLEKVAAELAALREAGPDAAAVAGHLERAERALGAVRGTDDVLDAAIERTTSLLRQLRLTGRGEKDVHEPLDVNDVVDGALVLLHNSLKHGVEVDVERAELPPVLGNASALGSIVINLLENARQALDDGGRVLVRTAVRDGAVVVTVADDGPGVSECRQERDRLFDPGYTTKGADEGTGLGLFIARRIAAGHGGTLTAANRDGGGAEFTLTLPAASGEGAGG